MDVRVLGPVEALVDGRPVALGARKQRALFAMLAMEANRPVAMDRLVDGLWGESPPSSAHKMVQGYVSSLRKALGGTQARIVTRGGGYELVCDADAVDLHRAEQLVAAAVEEPSPNGHARAALALWRGPPLADVADEPFAPEPIRACEELRLRAHELAIDADLARGRHDAVLAEVSALAAQHPLREHIQCQHLLALYRSGRQAEALDAYRAVHRRIVAAIGVEPGPELRRVHEAILRHDDVTPSRAAAQPSPHRRRPWRPALPAALAIGIVVVVAVTAAQHTGQVRLRENSIGLLGGDPMRVRAVEPVGRDPDALASGAGSLWVANGLDGTVTRLDRGGERRVTITVGAHPSALAFGAGSLWVVSGDDGRIAQVDPAANRVMQRIAVAGQPAGIVVAGEAVWAALPRDGVVAKVSLSAGRVTRRIAVGGGPVAVASGAGAVWVATEDANRVVRIDPATGTVTASIGVGNDPDAIAASDAAVWVANAADGTVSRIDPKENRVTGTVRIGAGVATLAAGGAGAVAVDDAGGVARIDPTGTHRVFHLATGLAIRAIAHGDGGFWMAAGAAIGRHRGGTLRSYGGDCDGPCPLDPAFAISDTFPALGVVYDGLLGYRRASGVAGSSIVPALAATLPAVTDHGRRYTFTLRPGLRYADGRPVRARDVRFSLERSIRVGHEVYPGLFAAVRGASACYLAPARCSLARGVVTDDQTGTVTIRLRRPDPLLPFKLAGLPASIVPSGTSDSIRGPRPPGTGPYRISAIARDGTTRLLRNVHFRSPSSDRPDGFPDAIVLRPSRPLAQRLHHVATGLSDVTSIDNGGRQLMPQEVSGALTRYPDRVTLAPELATDFMFLNVREPPFDDQRVRLAVNLATDRRRMVALRGGPWVAAPACSVVPPGVPHARPACPYTADPSPAGTWTAPDLRRARRLIARSGTRGEHVTVWSDTQKVRFGRYFSKLLRRLGYVTTLRILTVGFDYFHGVARARAHAQIGMYGWLADYPSPASFVDPIFSCAAWHPRSPENLNLSQLCDRALDRLVARAERADGPAGTRAWAAAERRLDRLAPAIPLSSQRRALFVSARTGNVRESPFLGPLLEQMWVR